MSNPPKSTNCMDKRCPRQLTEVPQSWCPLGVQRLKALRHAGRELSEDEESKLPGCPFAVNQQLANYCFFKLIDEFVPDSKGFSDMEVAHFLNVSIDSVKKTEKKAIQKMQESSSFKEIIDLHNGDRILDDNLEAIAFTDK